jgi:hypothetical protein
MPSSGMLRRVTLVRTDVSESNLTQQDEHSAVSDALTSPVTQEHETSRVSVFCRVINYNPKNGVFWDVTPCGSCKNRRFGGT